MPKKEMKQVTRELPEGARRVSRSGEGLTPLVEGEEIIGIFRGMKDQEITDRRTREKKHIRVYSILLDDGTTARIGSRHLLDDAYDELTEGNPDALKDKRVSFIRGGDVQTGEGNPMGTYEIIVY